MWPSVKEELEKFREQIYKTNFKFDYDFFVRCLSAISFKESLKKKNCTSIWREKRFRRLGEESKGWNLLAYINRRYSGAKFANLDKDIELVHESSNPVEDWTKALEKDREIITSFKPEEIEESNNTTFQLALFVLLKSMNVKQDLLGRNFLENAASQEDKPEFHHIFPRKCLEGTQYEEICDHIANLTIITSKSNKEISKKQPSYLLQISDELKRQHFISQDRNLYKVDRYEEFLKERQKLIANALNNFLSQKRLKDVMPEY